MDEVLFIMDGAFVYLNILFACFYCCCLMGNSVAVRTDGYTCISSSQLLILLLYYQHCRTDYCYYIINNIVNSYCNCYETRITLIQIKCDFFKKRTPWLDFEPELKQAVISTISIDPSVAATKQFIAAAELSEMCEIKVKFATERN